MVDIKKALDDVGGTRKAIAAAVGVSRQHLYEIERGKVEPGSRVIARLLSFLNRPEHLRKLGRRRPLTLDDLVGGETGRAA